MSIRNFQITFNFLKLNSVQFNKIKIAKDMAGIKPDDDVTVLEYPKLGLFNISEFLSSIIGFNINQGSRESTIIDFMTKYNGKPIPMMPLDYFELSDIYKW